MDRIANATLIPGLGHKREYGNSEEVEKDFYAGTDFLLVVVNNEPIPPTYCTKSNFLAQAVVTVRYGFLMRDTHIFRNQIGR
jgi:hypothetical protein